MLAKNSYEVSLADQSTFMGTSKQSEESKYNWKKDNGIFAGKWIYLVSEVSLKIEMTEMLGRVQVRCLGFSYRE